MSSEKKHHWLVSYISNDKYVGSAYGSITVWTRGNYFNNDARKAAQQHIPENHALISVSYLGEMTDEEMKGEE